MTTPTPAPTPAPAPAPARKQGSFPFPLQDGEQVLQVSRRHWLHLWPRLIFLTVVAVAPPALVAYLLSSADEYEGTVAKVYWVVAGVYLAYWGVRIFLTWYRYNHDLWVITNQRLIDSLKRHPFSLDLATADLVNLQDLRVERKGLLQTVFDFGDIFCQTAGEQESFRLSGIPGPREVQALIDRERDRERLRYRA